MAAVGMDRWVGGTSSARRPFGLDRGASCTVDLVCMAKGSLSEGVAAMEVAFCGLQEEQEQERSDPRT